MYKLSAIFHQFHDSNLFKLFQNFKFALSLSPPYFFSFLSFPHPIIISLLLVIFQQKIECPSFLIQIIYKIRKYNQSFICINRFFQSNSIFHIINHSLHQYENHKMKIHTKNLLYFGFIFIRLYFFLSLFVFFSFLLELTHSHISK